MHPLISENAEKDEEEVEVGEMEVWLAGAAISHRAYILPLVTLYLATL